MDLILCEKTVQARLSTDMLLPDWSLTGKRRLRLVDHEIPLMPWRFNRRLETIYELIYVDGAVKNLCSYKSIRIDHTDSDLEELLYSELDTCEWLVGDKITSIYALQNQKQAILAVALMNSGVTATIELAATLSKESIPVTRHEIIAVEGVIMDRAINEQVPVETVYLYTADKKEPVGFTDMDISMFGLSPDEVEIVDNAVDLLKHQDRHDYWLRRDKQLCYLANCAICSAKTGEKVIMEVNDL
jgi:hypothetical protein